jgi:CRP-like cAMP-binding protein
MSIGLPSISLHNHILRDLPRAERAALLPSLRPVRLEETDALGDEALVGTITFIETGILAVIGRTSEGRSMALTLLGREAAAGSVSLFGLDRRIHEQRVVVPGWGWALPAKVGRLLLPRLPVFGERLTRHLHCTLLQSQEGALAAALTGLEARLVRCLLMCHDRIDGDELLVTHAELALLLGVRRASVTVALQILEGEGLLRSKRARVIIRDRVGLEGLARGAYGCAEREERRLSRQAAAPAPASAEVVAVSS